MNLKTLALGVLAASPVTIAMPAAAGQNDVPIIANTCSGAATALICSGTLAGVRAQAADPTAYVRFTMNNGQMAFVMRRNGTTYVCIAPESLRSVWTVAMSGVGFFHVQMNANTGTCDSVFVSTGSEVKNANAL